jgi:23S rRNA (cytidine1920-2'-O)/16S rRNA (cytidine1409-2'-O)-methyltransferase
MDVSFISVTKVLPAIVSLLAPGRSIVTLIKPQFEVGRGEVGGGGIVRDESKRLRVVEEVNNAARTLGLEVVNVIESPITGAEGNQEYLAHYTN